MKENYEIRALPYEQAVPWFLYKHYARRVPSITWAFGLYREKVLLGVVSYGTPASSTLLTGVCGPEHADKVIELNRLVVEDGVEKNTASLLVGKSIRLLPKPKIIVSYADSGQGHVGKVYQACNFVYTGLSTPFTDPRVKGLEHQHHATYAHGMSNEELLAKYGDDLYFVDRARKHRYIYFVGCSELRSQLKYEEMPYPKGESVRYDAGPELPKQTLLF